MISLDWKDRLQRDSIDFFERKIPGGDYDFDIIYNAYPKREKNTVPREVVTLVADTLASKMLKNHSQYLKFCDYIWQHKGENGRIVFACLVSKFIKKDSAFYLDYAKQKLVSLQSPVEIHLLIEKIFVPVIKKQPNDYIETLLAWLKEDNDKVNPPLIKMILRIGKSNPDFLKRFTTKLENRWLGASEEFVHLCGNFLKSLGKVDSELYLSFYRNYRSTREPVFVEILTSGLMMYDDMLYEIYENWSRSGNARLKKAAMVGFRYLKKKKG